MRPMKRGCVTRPAFGFGSGAVKGTIVLGRPAVCRAVPRPVETSEAEHSCNEFQICLAMGTGAGVRASGGSIPLPLGGSAWGAGSSLPAADLQGRAAGAKLAVVSEGSPELC